MITARTTSTIDRWPKALSDNVLRSSLSTFLVRETKKTSPRKEYPDHGLVWRVLRTHVNGYAQHSLRRARWSLAAGSFRGGRKVRAP